MRKIRILLCALFISGGLLLSQQQAKAQFVVSDPTNLVQNILQYIMDQIREGNLDLAEGLSKLEGMREEFKALEERIQQVKTILDAWEKIKDITYIGEQVYADWVNMQRIADLMAGLGGYGTVALVDNLAEAYRSVALTLIEDVKNQVFDIRTITQSDPLKIVEQLHDKIEYLYQGYIVLRSYFYGAIQDAYYSELNLKSRLIDEQFLRQIFI